jgi:hypothetical protein
MRTQPRNAIEAFSLLLLQWVDVSFPAQSREVSKLNHLWFSLAQALCGSHRSKIAVFQREMAQLRSTVRAGEPPIQALEQRLNELTQAGLREYFLVIAVRQAMEQLILTEYPPALDQWKQLADDMLPLQIQFARQSNEMPSVRAILRPDVEA